MTGSVEPETVLAYALASKKQEGNDKALRQLVDLQNNQAKELSDLRVLLEKM